jgi:hypothetical protein
MNRTLFYIGLILPFSVLGLAMRFAIGFEAGIKVLQYLIAFYLPVLTFIRMRYIGLSYKQMLTTFIPIYGLKHRYRVFTEK